MIGEMLALNAVVICGHGADFDVSGGAFVPTKTGARPALWYDLRDKRCRVRFTMAEEVGWDRPACNFFTIM
jgi:hypothetical protein